MKEIAPGPNNSDALLDESLKIMDVLKDVEGANDIEFVISPNIYLLSFDRTYVVDVKGMTGIRNVRLAKLLTRNGSSAEITAVAKEETSAAADLEYSSPAQ